VVPYGYMILILHI